MRTAKNRFFAGREQEQGSWQDQESKQTCSPVFFSLYTHTFSAVCMDEVNGICRPCRPCRCVHPRMQVHAGVRAVGRGRGRSRSVGRSVSLSCVQVTRMCHPSPNVHRCVTAVSVTFGSVSWCSVNNTGRAVIFEKCCGPLCFPDFRSPDPQAVPLHCPRRRALLHTYVRARAHARKHACTHK